MLISPNVYFLRYCIIYLWKFHLCIFISSISLMFLYSNISLNFWGIFILTVCISFSANYIICYCWICLHLLIFVMIIAQSFLLLCMPANFFKLYAVHFVWYIVGFWIVWYSFKQYCTLCAAIELSGIRSFRYLFFYLVRWFQSTV